MNIEKNTSYPVAGIIEISHPLAKTDGALRARVKSIHGNILTGECHQSLLMLKDDHVSALIFIHIQKTEINAINDGVIYIPEISSEEAIKTLNNYAKYGQKVSLSKFAFSRKEKTIEFTCEIEQNDLETAAFDVIFPLLSFRLEAINSVGIK